MGIIKTTGNTYGKPSTTHIAQLLIKGQRGSRGKGCSKFTFSQVDTIGTGIRACNRLVGQGNVGQIIFEPWFGNITPNPTFYISGARQWCAKNGIALNARGGTKIGSGVERGDDAK